MATRQRTQQRGQEAGRPGKSRPGNLQIQDAALTAAAFST
jgi:hypothetical protein